MVRLVEDAEVERQHAGDESQEGRPSPDRDHQGRLGEDGEHGRHA